MSSLCRELELVKKDEFGPGDRIVFVLFDHDFYLDNTGPGWTLYNLQLILSYLDIPNYFCLLLTKMPDYDDLTCLVQTNLTNDDFPIRSITTLLNKDFFPDRDVSPRESHIDRITKSFCVLSRQARPHRTFFISRLWSEGVLDHGIIGYNNIQAPNLISDNNAKFANRSVDLSLLEIPSSWQRVLLRKESNRQIFQQFNLLYQSYKNFVDTVDLDDKNLSCLIDNPVPIAQALLYVAIETEVEIPKVFISRITTRGILERRPFVIFGCRGALKFLRSRGFKTFGDFWDESYDDISDSEDRVEKILQIIKNICQMNRGQLINLYQDLREVVDHNYYFYLHKFLAAEKKLFTINCEKNLRNEHHH